MLSQTFKIAKSVKTCYILGTRKRNKNIKNKRVRKKQGGKQKMIRGTRTEPKSLETVEREREREREALQKRKKAIFQANS